MILHDRHLYTTKASHQLINNVVWYRDNPPPAETPKTRYRLSREKFISSEYVFCSDYWELQKLFEKESKKPVNVYVNDVRGICFDIIEQAELQPAIKLNSQYNICGVYFKIKNTEFKIMSEKNAYVEDFILMNTEQFEAFSFHLHNFKQEVINKTCISEYSASQLDAIQNYNRTPMYGCFVREYPNYCLDICKDYTSILMEMKEVPVFTRFDDFDAFDGSDINDLGFYQIRMDEVPEFLGMILCNKLYDVVSGLMVKKMRELEIKFTILKMLVPQRRVAINLADGIKKLYDDNRLPIVHKKNIPNIVTGLLIKKYNKKIVSGIFRDKDEADHLFPYVKHEIGDNTGDSYYIGHKSEKSLLTDGFYWVGQLIYDHARLKLFDLACVVNKFGRVYAVKVDAVYFDISNPPTHSMDNSTECPSALKQALGDRLAECRASTEFEPGSEFTDIGKYRLEGVGSNHPKNEIVFNETVGDHIRPVVHETKSLAGFENEFGEEFRGRVLEVYSGQRRLMILGEYAGVGKTQSVMTYCEAAGISKEEVLFTTFTNELRLKIIADGWRAVTANTLLGIGVNDMKMNRVNLDGVRVIVLDEIMMYSLNLLMKIDRSLMGKHPDIQYMATGDINQNQPVEEYDYPVEYHKYCVEKMFPVNITLRHNKRIKCSDCSRSGRCVGDCDACNSMRQKYYKICDELKGNTDWMEVLRRHLPEAFTDKFEDLYVGAENVVYYNATADLVNYRIKGRSDWIVGDIAMCKEHLVVTRDKKKYKFFVHNLYSVVDVEDQRVTLRDSDGKRVSIPKAKLSHFKPPYARTCHSLQGRSCGDRVNIFDITGRHVDWRWVYTAFTRCTTLQVKFFTGRIRGAELNRGYVSDKINSYYIQDVTRFGYCTWDNYVNVADVLNMLAARPLCSYCGAEISRGWTLDRIDNMLPHTKTNVTLCCQHCNATKK